MALCGLASYGLGFFTVIDMCGLVWSCMASLWPYMFFYGRISSFLAVIDPNSFGLVDSKKTFLGGNYTEFFIMNQ